MRSQLSTRLIIFVIIALAILSVAITTITFVNAQLDGFARPAAVTATMIAGPSSSSTSPLPEKQFSAVLTGDNEVPTFDTEATGRIKLMANSQQSALAYQISLSNLNGLVTAAHIHRGSVGTNGPVVKTGHTIF